MAAKKARTKRAPKKRSAPDWAPRFLAELADSSNIKESCRAAKIARSAVYKRRDSDPDFAAAVVLALEDSCDDLELEARRRARDGVERPVYQGGEKVGTVTDYSDTLLIFLLKAHRPEKYRDRHEHTHKGAGKGGAIPITIVEVVRPPTPANDECPVPGPGDGSGGQAEPQLPPGPDEGVG